MAKWQYYSTSILANRLYPPIDPTTAKEKVRSAVIDSIQHHFVSDEGRALITRLLTRKFGNLAPKLVNRVNQLSIEQLEPLGEALLDFNSLAEPLRIENRRSGKLDRELIKLERLLAIPSINSKD